MLWFGFCNAYRLTVSIMLRIIWIVLVGFFPLALAQSTDEISKDINKAIEQGSARAMSRYFGQNVELYLPGSEGTFSKAQSEIILRDFFSRNTPETYTVSHQRSARDGSLYVIGTLQTKEGQHYRTYYLIKRVSQTYFLHQLQIEAR